MMFDMKLKQPFKVLAALVGSMSVCFQSEMQTQAQTQAPLQTPSQVLNQQDGLNGESDSTAMREQHFTLKVLPLLKSKCLGCHGAAVDDIKGEFDVRTRAGLLSGGESGDPGVVPGDLDSSNLIQAIRWDGLEMPPK